MGIGCVVQNFNQHADVYIINTCTVTHASDKKSRQVIRRARKQNPNAVVAVCGCMAKSDPTAAVVLGVDFIFDARSPEAFLSFVSEMHRTQGSAQIQDLYSAKSFTPTRTRAFLKIQDGCDRFCSYCIVPYVRGKPISRSVSDVITEARSLIANGTQEIVLTGIQVASYGEDTSNDNLISLLSQISDLTNLKRLRLSSIEPCIINSDFLALISSSSILCDHFHLSLQSGCDTTLARMNRRYTSAKYAEIVASIRNVRPSAAITTDIIVGFPGETDEEFAQTLTFVQKINFARIHVFEYSKREGTPAATFAGQIEENVKTKRSRELRELALMQQKDFYQTQIGDIVPVLFESSKTANKWQGYTSNYCPVEVICDANIANTILGVKITAFSQNGLEGEISK